MDLKVGTRLTSAVCTAQAIIIRPPSAEGVLTCGGAPMAALGAAAAAAQLAAPQEGAAAAGKRYVDAATGLEVLCTKAGHGAFAFADRALSLKEAKPLPASD